MDDWHTSGDRWLFSAGIPYSQNDAWYLSLHSVVGIHFRWDAGSGDYGYWYVNDNQNMGWENGSTHDIAITWKDWDHDGLLEYKYIIDGVEIDSDHYEHTDPSNTNDLTAQDFYIGAINGNGAQSLTGGMIENFQVSNIALNETLKRTVITSLTTMLVVVILFVWGGKVINLFAFALIVGVFVGTYSSLFVASPVMVFCEKRSLGPKRK